MEALITFLLYYDNCLTLFLNHQCCLWQYCWLVNQSTVKDPFLEAIRYADLLVWSDGFILCLFNVLRLTPCVESFGSPRLITLLLDLLNRVYTYGLIICTKKAFPVFRLIAFAWSCKARTWFARIIWPVTVPPDSFKTLVSTKDLFIT